MKIKATMQEVPMESTNSNPVKFKVELAAVGDHQECKLLMKAISDFKFKKGE